MARTVRDAKLESRAARAALKPSGKPYYRAISEGLHLGYRKGQTTGKWVMRRHVGGAKVYEVAVIGTADDVLDPDGDLILNFAQAQAKARTLFMAARRVAVGLPIETGPYRVADAIREYLEYMEQHRKSAKDARWRAEALILPELGGIACDKLTSKLIGEWRDKIATTPARRRTGRGATV
jgi:hypothetical protein